jgi:hypothetical protein
MRVWEYYAANPDEGARFDAAMAAITGGLAEAVVSSYDFSGFERGRLPSGPRDPDRHERQRRRGHTGVADRVSGSSRRSELDSTRRPTEAIGR